MGRDIDEYGEEKRIRGVQTRRHFFLAYFIYLFFISHYFFFGYNLDSFYNVFNHGYIFSLFNFPSETKKLSVTFSLAIFSFFFTSVKNTGKAIIVFIP